MEEQARICAVCGARIKEGDPYITDYEGDLICERCARDYRQCDVCGEWYPAHQVYEGTNSFTICQNCWVNGDYFQCESCGRILYIDEYAEDGLCRDCYHPAIRSYHDRPELVFHGDAPFYGIELETDRYREPEYAAEMVRDIDPTESDFWLSRDGSLDSGFEIDFQPRSFDSWQEYFPHFAGLCQTIRELGGRSFDTDTCGIHIHRSREDLTDLTVTKLVTLFIRMRYYIERIAQRNSCSWASFDFLEQQVKGDCKLVYKTYKAGGFTLNRYVAINFQNRHTVEFRIFKGTLAVQTIYNYLSFVHHIVKFAKVQEILHVLNAPASQLWEEFVEYVKEEDKKLVEYIQRRIR